MSAVSASLRGLSVCARIRILPSVKICLPLSDPGIRSEEKEVLFPEATHRD